MNQIGYSGKKVSWFLAFIVGLGVLLVTISCKDDIATNNEPAARSYATDEIITLTNASGDTIYTGPRYNRQFQTQVQEILIGMSSLDIYDSSFFHLDATNTDHFYEDIGKYSKCVFGWVDWYFRFAADESGNFQTPQWVVDGPLDSPNTLWTGNYPLWGANTQTFISPSSNEASAMRATYNDLLH